MLVDINKFDLDVLEFEEESAIDIAQNIIYIMLEYTNLFEIMILFQSKLQI